MVTGPPPRPTPEQRAEIARLTALGIPPGLAADAAFGRLRTDDVERWHRESEAEREALRCRGGWVASATAGGDVIGVDAPPANGEVIWVGRVGKKRKLVQRQGAVTRDVPADLWTCPGEPGWWRVPGGAA